MSDANIYEHPAVKALQEQLEFTKQQVTGEVENAGYFKERYQDMQSLADKQSQRIATLEATNAAQAERIAALETTQNDPYFKVWKWHNEQIRAILQSPTPAESQPVSANQPDSGKVPPGYALVPIEPTPEMIESAVNAGCPDGEGLYYPFNKDEIGIAYCAMLAASPSAQIVKKVKMRLTSGEDGVFAHFQIGDGYQCGINLDHQPLCKRFCDEYRAVSAAPVDSVEEGKL